MPKVITSRRLLYGLVAVTFIFANPLHLPFTLPWLARQWEGTALGSLLARYEGPILVLSTVYFMIAMTSFYFWLWNKRLRRRAVASLSVAADGHSPSRPAAPEAPYRGPGGGKRPPRLRHRRIRR